MKYINVRGPNGAGKTTLLRNLVKHAPFEVRMIQVPDHALIPFTYANGFAILGDYAPQAFPPTTAGCDRVKTQAATKAALEKVGADPEVQCVLFEGVVVSTIYGPWRDWARANGGMAWAFLDTPLDECLRRIQQRNGGRPIQEDQVADKHRTIQRVRAKALADGERVYNLAWEDPLTGLQALIHGM